MKEVMRWAGFTGGVVLIAVTILFTLHFLSRSYEELHSPAMMFVTLIVFSFVVSIAAIAYASKLDREDEEIRFRRIQAKQRRGQV